MTGETGTERCGVMTKHSEKVTLNTAGIVYGICITTLYLIEGIFFLHNTAIFSLQFNLLLVYVIFYIYCCVAAFNQAKDLNCSCTTALAAGFQ